MSADPFQDPFPLSPIKRAPNHYRSHPSRLNREVTKSAYPLHVSNRAMMEALQDVVTIKQIPSSNGNNTSSVRVKPTRSSTTGCVNPSLSQLLTSEDLKTMLASCGAWINGSLLRFADRHHPPLDHAMRTHGPCHQTAWRSHLERRSTPTSAHQHPLQPTDPQSRVEKDSTTLI